MRFAENPLVEEAVTHRIFGGPAAALLAAHLLLLTAVILLSWPRPAPAETLLLGVTPRTYRSALLLAFLSLAFINAFLDTPRLRGRGGYSHGQWLRLSPVGLASFFGGKLTAMLMQTVLLTAVTLPLLTAAAAVSGAGLTDVSMAGAAILLFTFTYRVMGFSLALAFENRPLVLAILDTAILLAVLFGSAAVAPASNPIVVLAGIESEDTLLFQNLLLTGTPASRLLSSWVLHAVLFAVFFVAAVLYGRRARKTQKVYSGAGPRGRAGTGGTTERHSGRHDETSA